MIFGQVIQTWYERRLRAELARGPVPRHIGLVMDGNRRWARQVGYSDPSIGHRHGAEHIATVLDWCVHVGVGQVTVFLASVDNLRKRAAPEMQGLMEIVETVVAGSLIERSERWRLHVAGDLDALPDHTRHALKLAVEQTRDRAAGFDLTVAIGYDGRSEIADAVRSLLDEAATAGTSLEALARRLTAEDIAAHLYTAGRADLDLVIRTSGEQRLSGFLLWQSADAELHFCDVYWPGFRHVDFLRAIRSYARSNPRRKEGPPLNAS